MSRAEFAARDRISGLYAITPDGVRADALYRMVEAALMGGARIIQYRQKNIPAALKLAEANVLNDLCIQHKAVFIINDDVELAQQIGLMLLMILMVFAFFNDITNLVKSW